MSPYNFEMCVQIIFDPLHHFKPQNYKDLNLEGGLGRNMYKGTYNKFVVKVVQ